jgi:hypothetical protein
MAAAAADAADSSLEDRYSPCMSEQASCWYGREPAGRGGDEVRVGGASREGAGWERGRGPPQFCSNLLLPPYQNTCRC